MSNGVVCCKTLGIVFGILEAPGDTFGCLGRSLGTFFGIWTAPWGLGDLVAPNGFQNLLFGFWMPVGLHFGRLLGVRVGSGKSFGSLLVPFGRSLALAFGFCVGNRETVKSVVLLKENLCFEG